jgi:uncharacterized protein (DUF342 family)
MNQASRDQARFKALKKKYEADIAIAKAELDNYFEASVGVGDHPHIIESMDLLMTQLANAEEKLKCLEANF